MIDSLLFPVHTCVTEMRLRKDYRVLKDVVWGNIKINKTKNTQTVKKIGSTILFVKCMLHLKLHSSMFEWSFAAQNFVEVQTNVGSFGSKLAGD